jgi:hypothetical protein
MDANIATASSKIHDNVGDEFFMGLPSFLLSGQRRSTRFTKRTLRLHHGLNAVIIG